MAKMPSNPGSPSPVSTFELALEAAELGFWDLDVSTRRVTRNLRHDQIFGYPELLPEWTYDRFLSHVHADDQTAIDAFVGTLDAHTHRVFECRITRADGAAAWIAGRARAVPGVNGAPARLVGIVSDITERKQRETAFMHADLMKQQFLATIAHELRQPLSPLVAAVGVLNLHIGPEANQRAIDVIGRQVRAIKRLVDDLLDSSRLLNQKMELKKQRMDARRSIAEAAENVESLMNQRTHRFTVSLPDAAVWLIADPDRMQQVLSNLLRNAALYTDYGGDVSLALAVGPGTVTISVRDNGKGISAEMLPHVFTTFGPAVGGNYGGLGIGLNLARGLVELHGGSLIVSSAGVNHGAEFVVTLPRDGNTSQD
jgi:PAS domain S-box-containing protein